MQFAAPNDLGVLDHDVFPEGKDPVHMSVRVMPNGSGAEVSFLLLQLPGMSDVDFERDMAAVRKDLDTLKALLEA